MAISRRSCCALLFLCFALVLVCVADEVNKKDNSTTIHGDNVSAKILGKSGKIMIARSKKDDKDDGNDGNDRQKDGKGDSKDSVDIKDADSQDDKDNGDDAGDTDDKYDDDFKDDNKDLLSFELAEIEEKDSDGNPVDDKHSVDSFNATNFQFSQVRFDAKFQGLSAINVNLSTYLGDPKANLDIMVFLFLEAGKIRFGNETFAVQPGMVKFNIKISNWDFCDGSPSDGCSKGKAGEYLDLSLKFRSKGSPVEVDDDDRKKANKTPVCDAKNNNKGDDKVDGNNKDDDDDCPIIYDMGGNSEMLLNRGVMKDDDKYTAMPAGFPKFERGNGQSKFVFRIPRFNKSVLVDPSVRAGSAASWMQVNFLTCALLFPIAVMFAAH